jgi:hypothetical protein
MTGDALYLEGSPEHGIVEGDPFKEDYCCKSPNDVWSPYNEEPPCEICPRYDFTLLPSNEYAYQRWQQLDYTGRNRGMQEEPLREEAITSCLIRYSINTPEFYEKILQIEMTLFGRRMKDREEKRQVEERKRKSQQASKSRRK